MAATPCTASRCWWDDASFRVAGDGWTALGCAGRRSNSLHAARRKPGRFSRRGLGRDETFYTCTACHGFKLVAQQGMTRAQWEDSINLMIRRHNMPPLDARDRGVVLNYLETAYPPRAPAARGGWQNPFAK